MPLRPLRPLLSNFLSISLTLPLCMAFSGLQSRRQPDLGLAVRVHGRMLAHGVPGSAHRLVPRSELHIVDEVAAEGFTAIWIISEEEAGAIRVNLSVTYGDVKGRIFWKDKTEKPAGTYVVHLGETIRATELKRFGIEPLEMRGVDARPVEIGLGESPIVINNSQSLQVVALSRSMDTFTLTLKNTAEKTIGRFTVAYGSGSQSSGGIRPGDLREVHMEDAGIEEKGITIQAVVFDDGTFEPGAEGDAVGFLAERRGQRIQAPSVLARIVQTSQVGDGELVVAFENLEAGLWTMPEAIGKEPAAELLRSQYPSMDDRSIEQLYERLKGGLYLARNLALSRLGELKRRLAEGLPELTPEEEVAAIRRLLNEIKVQLEAMIARGPR